MKKKISVTEYEIKAPIEHNLSFVFLSDLHGYPNEPIFDTISLLKPDAILVGGDFLSESKNSNCDREFFEFAVSVAPTFCILGNHEMRNMNVSSQTIKEWVAETGAAVLDNEYAEFHGIYIGGLTSSLDSFEYVSAPQPNTKWLKKFGNLCGYKLLISHHPEHYKAYIKPLPIDLTLSGHAHGGQWRFFGRGIFAPGQGFFPKYSFGLYDKRMIVSRGIGNQTVFPRINNKPEIVSLKLIAVK